MKIYKTIALAGLFFLAIAACKKEEPVVVVTWTPASTSATFNLGESQTIAAVAENIDYVEVSAKPEGWTVNATVSSISIKAPAGTESSFAFSGNVELKAVNREEEKNVPVSIAVSVDQSKINGVVNMISDVKYATNFYPGTTMVFDFTSAFVKSLEVSCAEGWTALIDQAAGTVTVTAPSVDFDESVNLSSKITISGKSITGKDIDPVSFDVTLMAYLINSDLFDPDTKTFDICDPDGYSIAFAARELEEAEEEGGEPEERIYIYMNTNDKDSYTGISVPDGIPFVILPGAIATTDYTGDPIAVTAKPYTVKDIDGNEYSTVFIKGKLWMDDNLKVTKAPDGTALEGMKSPNGADDNVQNYGYLYNKTLAFNGGEAVNGMLQGICPDGWHLPDPEEICGSSFEEVMAQEGDAAGVIPNLNQMHVNTLTKVMAGLYTQFYGRDMYMMFDKCGSYQLAHSDGIMSVIVMPGIPTSPAFQKYPTYYTAVRCIKDTVPFYIPLATAQ